MAKGFPDYGGVLVTVRLLPRWRAEIRQAAKQLDCTASDIYREAIEQWLLQHRNEKAPTGDGRSQRR